MTANPILAEVTRGNWVENRHRGSICICDAKGNVLASTGDIERAIFPRSAIKSMQGLAIFRSGAAQRFELGPQALALACASHLGEAEHVRGVVEVLDKIGLDKDALECGAHPPVDRATRKALVSSGERPSALHNNCSGKHAGMLAVAKALGVDHHGYVERDHAVQKLVRECVEDVIGEPLTEDRCGTDGCSIPTWAAPLKAFARGFARMATGEGLDERTAAGAQALFDAATSNPFLVRGTNGIDTLLMQAFGGRLMSKVGAEGVYCGAIRDKGIGYAIKIDDGHADAAGVVLAKMLLSVADPNETERAALEAQLTKVMTNWRGIDVATYGATDAAALTL